MHLEIDEHKYDIDNDEFEVLMRPFLKLPKKPKTFEEYAKEINNPDDAIKLLEKLKKHHNTWSLSLENIDNSVHIDLFIDVENLVEALNNKS